MSFCTLLHFIYRNDKNLCYASDPCARTPCQRGTCRPVDPFLSTDVICDCPPGYTGRFCDTLIDTCLRNEGLCRNGGTCVPTVGSFSCLCPPGFQPPYCEPIDYCSLGVCQLNGSQSKGCRNEPPGYRCVCKEGYTGPSCNIPIDVCSSQPCLNGGFCQVTKPGAFTCVCPAGFSGHKCEILPTAPLCSENNCRHGGTCMPGYGPYEVCKCRPGWRGPACEYPDPCYPNPCGMNGVCYEV